MEILKVKENEQDSNTYKVTLLDGTVLHSVPKVNGNKDYALVQEWKSNGGVVEPFETAAEAAARLIAEENAAAKAELERIDLESVRSIREWITSQPNAPQFLIDKENAAQAARARIK